VVFGADIGLHINENVRKGTTRFSAAPETSIVYTERGGYWKPNARAVKESLEKAQVIKELRQNKTAFRERPWPHQTEVHEPRRARGETFAA